MKRAEDRGGRYDMLALSDFNEIERSSTYVVFFYLDKRMLATNEIKYELKKNRIGATMGDIDHTTMIPKFAYVGDSIEKQSSNDLIDSEGGIGDIMDFSVDSIENSDSDDDSNVKF